MTAAVLAGGLSSRMGEDKSLLKLGGRYIIEILLEKIRPLFERVFIVTNGPEGLEFLNAELAEDIIKGSHSSLRGIYSALSHSGSEYTFVFACDMPFVNGELIKYMISQRRGYDVVMPKTGDRNFEPLHAIYSARCAEPFRAQLGRNEPEIKRAFSALKVRTLAEKEIRKYAPAMLSFFNINTKEDYNKAVKLWEDKL